MDVKINFNDIVKVKLTDRGKEIMKQRHDELNALIIKKSRSGKVFREFTIKIDREGYTSFLLWQLMNTFGEYMVMGLEEPFEGTMVIINGEPTPPTLKNS
jgi:hypothetical protein